jgi:histidinol-phosphate/aromatic aminotransferase/cobyric acid decarboxylase-like protein
VDVLQKDLLESAHILIRDCRSFEGLDERYFRLAVRLPEQNDRVLEGITRWAGAAG